MLVCATRLVGTREAEKEKLIRSHCARICRSHLPLLPSLLLHSTRGAILRSFS